MFKYLLTAYTRRPTRTAILIALIVGAGLLLVWQQVGSWYEAQLLAEQRSATVVEASARGTTLSSVINRRLARLAALHAFVQTELTDTEFREKFLVFASQLHKGDPGIRNFAIAPGGVMQYVYPLAGNESVIGYEPAQDPRPDVRDDVERALISGQIILSGPADLVQGGLGLIARQAVYHNGEPWGLVNIVVTIPSLLDESGLVDPSDQLQFALRDSHGRVFAGPEAVFDANPVIVPIDLPEGGWELAAIPAGGWDAAIAEPLRLFQTAGLVIVALLTVLLGLTVNRQARLDFAVQERTREITRINEQLEIDIAGRKQAEAALQTSEERFRSAFDYAAVGMALIAPDNRFLRVNHTYCRIVGYQASELLAITFLAITYADDIDLDVENFQKLLSGEIDHYTMEKRFIHKDGYIVWALLTVSLVRGPAGEPLYSISQVQDITERKRAEEELRHSQQQYEQLVNTIDGIVWEADAQTFVFSFISQQAERLLGYPVSRWLSEPTFWPDHIHPADRDWAVNYCTLATAEQRAHEFEYRMIAADGRLVWLRDIVTVVIENGEPSLLRGIMIDITEKKQAEMALHAGEARLRALVDAIPDLMLRLNRDGVFLDFHAERPDELLAPPDSLMGSNLRDTAMAPDLIDQVMETIHQALDTGEMQTLAYALPLPDGLHHYEARNVASGPDEVVTIVRDVTEQVQAQRLLERRVTERTRELQTLLEITHNVASTLELRPLLELILDQLRLIVAYHGATIFALDDDELSILAYRGPISAEQAAQVRYSLHQARANAEVIARREPVIIDDVTGDSPLAHDFQAMADSQLETMVDYVRCWLGIPLLIKDRVIGMLSLEHSEPGFYTPQHGNLALALANFAAVAIENATLYRQAQQLAALEERQRLARELHDSVSQALYGMALGARTARRLLDRAPADSANGLAESLSKPLDYVLSLAEVGLTEMRALIFELRPEALEVEGLVIAISKHAAALQARYELVVETAFANEPEIALSIKEMLYRIAQEAMHNIVKHAKAARVAVSLLEEEGQLVLVIQDDGRGFDPQGDFPGHLGLRSMRERAEKVGAAFCIESAPNQGTRIKVQVPVPVMAGVVANGVAV